VCQPPSRAGKTRKAVARAAVQAFAAATNDETSEAEIEVAVEAA
jgi:flagellar transcriptional activator FlhC